MKKNIYLMYAIGLLQGMVFYGPIATLYRQAQGITVFQITLIESISLALCIALEVPWGVVADRIGYRKTMVFCCELYFVSKILFWQATNFWWFLAERILLSVVIAGMSGVDSSILYLSCQGRSSQKVFGIYSGMGMAGLLIAAGVFSLVVRDNYPLAACLTVISYALAAVLALGLTEVKQETSPQHHRQLRKAPPKGSLVLFLLAAAFLAETHQTITVFLNQLQYQRCGLGEGAMGWAYILATILGLSGIFSAGVTKRTGVLGSCLLFAGLSIGACLVLAWTRSGAASVGSILLLRLSNTLFQPFQAQMQNRQIQTENRATALSVNAMLMDCVAVGSNLVFGALSEYSLTSAFVFGGILSAVALLLLLAWYRKTAAE